MTTPTLNNNLIAFSLNRPEFPNALTWCNSMQRLSSMSILDVFDGLVFVRDFKRADDSALSFGMVDVSYYFLILHVISSYSYIDLKITSLYVMLWISQSYNLVSCTYLAFLKCTYSQIFRPFFRWSYFRVVIPFVE